MSKKSTKIIFVLKFECIFLLLILQLQPPPTHHSSGQAEQRKAAAAAAAVGHPVTVNNGDRNDSEKNEGRLCQNCDDATAADAAAAAGEERGGGGGDTAATRNYDYDEIGQAEVAASAAMDGGAPRESIPDGRMEVDNGDLDLEWDTDHGGIMGGLRTMTEPALVKKLSIHGPASWSPLNCSSRSLINSAAF